MAVPKTPTYLPLDERYIVRFLDRFDIPADPNACWEWTAGKWNTGYGYLPGPKGKLLLAHRLAYELSIGPMSPDAVTDHLCRNPSCVNPDHLEAVSERENILRGESGGAKNAVKTRCPQGHVYDEANTYRYKNERHCRACRRAQWHRRKPRTVTWQ